MQNLIIIVSSIVQSLTALVHIQIYPSSEYFTFSHYKVIFLVDMSLSNICFLQLTVNRITESGRNPPT